jgi:RND family efflux transporter MFP subunit
MRLFLLSFLLFLIGCKSDPSPDELINVETPVSHSHPLVSANKVSVDVFKHYHQVQGSLISKNMVYIRPEINGTVALIHVKEGDFVSKNQKLITLSTDLLGSQLNELEQQLSFTDFLYQKQKKLFDDGVSTEIQLKEAENRVETIKKTKLTLLTQLEKSILYAPFDGYIESTMVQIGEAISPLNPIFHLIGLNDLYVSADVSENLLSQISINNSVEVYFPAIRETIKNLYITRIGKLINATNRTVKIEAKINAPFNGLIPNLMAEIKINDYTNDSAICLSSRLILKDAYGKTFVKTIQGNLVKRIDVKVGKQQDELIEILSPIEVGTMIIDKGKSTVLEGQEIEIINSSSNEK